MEAIRFTAYPVFVNLDIFGKFQNCIIWQGAFYTDISTIFTNLSPQYRKRRDSTTYEKLLKQASK